MSNDVLGEEVCKILEESHNRLVLAGILKRSAMRTQEVAIKRNLRPAERAGEFVTQIRREMSNLYSYGPGGSRYRLCDKGMARLLDYLSHAGNWRDILEPYDFCKLGWTFPEILRRIIMEAKAEAEKDQLKSGNYLKVCLDAMQDSVTFINKLTTEVMQLNSLIPKREEAKSV